MKNEQIVNWFEDLKSEIKKSGNVKEVFLKFANGKNLAPALLEKLGHVYNTAKTVNYLDKTASSKRGSTFKILDIPDLLESYTKSSSDKHTYSSYGFEGEERVKEDLFNLNSIENITEEPVEVYSEQKIKMASEHIQSAIFKDSDVAEVNSRHLNQLEFELKEDLREVITKFASELRSTDITFEEIERDANYFFEGSSKEACELLANNMENRHVHVKRASDTGNSRLITDYTALNLVGQTQKLIQDLAVVKSSYFKEAHVKEEEEKKTDTVDKFFFFEKKAAETDTKTDVGDKPSTSGPGQTPPSQTAGVVSGARPPSRELPGEKGDVLKSLNEAFMPAVSATGQGAKALADLYETGNDKQRNIDLGVEEMEHAAILQNLITTDEILADEDPEKVIEAYNTLRELAPRLASDINIARVTLRSMIQHDGVSIFDANQFSKAELDKHKVDNSILAKDRISYGKKQDKKDTQVRLAV